MDITNTAHKHLELQVLERDINMISKGQRIEFYLQGDPMIKYAAVVYLINKMVDDDHMIKVHCHIEKENAKTLISGMYVTANIVTQSASLSALPKDAIVEVGGKSYALHLKSSNNDGYLFEKVELTTGHKNESYVELKNVDNLEGQYLTKGAYFIIM
jgi:cobalt-zinc-cadmium efflux system membrane fusion protein